MFLRKREKKAWFTPKEEAADIIYSFAKDTISEPYSWDDFETGPEENPEVITAICLCWYVAGRFPARHEKEYMHPDGREYFLKISELLRNGQLEAFDGFNHDVLRSEGPPADALDLLGLG